MKSNTANALQREGGVLMNDDKAIGRVRETSENVKRLSWTMLFAAGAMACAAVPTATQNGLDAAALAPVAQIEAPAIPEFDDALLAPADDDIGSAKSKPRRPQVALWTADDVTLPARGLTREENCLATAIYFEARGEPVKGQKAVAEVIMTRAGSGRYPASICGVVYQNSHQHLACQFTFTCDGKADRPRDPAAWTLARRIAVAALMKAKNKRPITKWATHYHATYVNPRWASRLQRTTTIGTHIFYRES
jgi:spore germination cell wall hydrolase CwlJ-like protein